MITVDRINPSLPDNFRKIQELKPNIVHPCTQSLCINTPLNTVGALAINPADLRQVISNELCKDEPPEIKILFEEPSKVFSNVPLWLRTSAEEYRLVDSAPHVFFKYGVGTPAGVVLEGQYSGMILRPFALCSPDEGLQISRIWNDSMPRPSRLPYSGPVLPKDYQLPKTDQDAYENIIRAGFQENILSKPITYLSEGFIDLCRARDIPIDPNAFCVMR